MSISSFINSLVPNIKRSDLEHNIQNTREQLEKNTLPMYESAISALSGHRISDPWLIEFERNFDRAHHTPYRGNYLSKIHAILSKADNVMKNIDNMIKEMKVSSISTNGITFPMANAIRLAEAATFATTYARHLLIYTLAVETDMLRQNQIVNYRLNSKQLRGLKNDQKIFFTCLKTLDADARKAKTIVQDIPRIEVTKDSVDQVVAAVGANSLDPTGLLRTGIILNPIYHVRMAIAEWEDTRRLIAIQEKEMVEFMIMDLKAAQQNNPNPNIQKAIEVNEERLVKLNKKIKDLEDV